jgi:uncharacterized protein with NAD-binding domain and iron-sulfur cluster
MRTRVLVLGGGVGGLSAAHELVERGFQVTIVEKGDVPGGKARSVRVDGSGTDGNDDLPGEHGFRFFPGFYRHLPDTMKRIPAGGGRRSVFDNLVTATHIHVLMKGQRAAIFPARFPRTVEDFVDLLTGVLNFSSFEGLTAEDVHAYYTKIWQILTSCEARRLRDYETVSWWEFVEADRHSDAYQVIFGRGMTRSLVAARAEEGNAKTLGDILVQLLFDLANPDGHGADRVLNGPTNAVWIEPWLAYLRQRGVTYRAKTEVVELIVAGDRIGGVRARAENGQDIVLDQFDWYVSALPVEVMQPLVSDRMKALDPKLKGLDTLATHVRWMNGIQFYLREDVPLTFGHQLYLDSPWALTSLSQAQFWKDVDLSEFGDGSVRGILSVDVSDWDSPCVRPPGKPAKLCTSDEVVREVWAQLKDALNVGPTPVLVDENLVVANIAPSIRFPKQGTAGAVSNAEPLLVNRKKTYAIRPEADTAIANLFLASDYVRTYTDLATMEAANEAARRAVNGILKRTRSPVTAYCQVWPLYEPRVVRAWRRADEARFGRGEAWSMELPAWVSWAHRAFLFLEPVIDPLARAAQRVLAYVRMPT